MKFKKKYGQNFLKDKNIVKRIVSLSKLDQNSLVIEVGPGGAIMTKELAKQAGNVLAYEIDCDLKEELASRLADNSNVSVLFKDFLEADLVEDIKKYEYQTLFFISNVPYYITTPIILKLIHNNLFFDKIVMMVQKEVGERFCANCGSKQYGSISVLLNYYFNIKKEFLVSRKEFIPEPNVDSMVLSFSPKRLLPMKDFSFFEKLIRDSFQYKRKTIRNNLKQYNLEIIEEVLKRYHFTLSVRAEELSYEIFVELANELLLYHNGE